MAKTGTHDISTLLAARFTSSAEFGLDTIAEILQEDLAAHNAITTSIMSELCDVTTDRQRIYGTSASTEMVLVDEYGRGPTQKQAVGATVGFPLNKYQYALGWTSTWLKTHTPRDMAIAVQAAEKAHLKQLRADIKKAFFLSSNYTHRDHLVDNIDFSVKRLLNADGDPIPDGPNGETFTGSSHTHYLANASLTTTVASNLINTVVEHGHGENVRIVIAQADEATWRALTGFQAYTDPRLILGTHANQPGARLDITRLDNRAIGIYGAAEVWVKPWAVANYAVCYSVAGDQKPLVMRQRQQESLQGLRIAAELDVHPLHARWMEAEFGVAAWVRTAAAVLYYAGGSYTDPTITA